MTVVRGEAARRLVARSGTRHVAHVTGGGLAAWAASTVVPQGPETPSFVRAFVRHHLESNRLAQRYDITDLVVHELVLNAATHGQGLVVLTLSGLPGGRLSVEVRDAGPVTAALQAARDRGCGLEIDATAVAAAGRGLEIVGLVAREWGIKRRTVGKDVWAVLDEEDE